MGAGRCGTVLAAIPALEPGARRPFALALECSGNEDAAIDACRVVRNRGEVVLVGTPWKRYTDRTAHELVWTIFHNYIVMRSGWEWEIGLQPEDFRPASIYGNMQGAVDWLASGRVVVDDLYEAVSPADAQSAYQSLLHGAATRLGVVFDWRRV
jgi:threonine dehydrogenase-like Zn-dependent dehydrogenase